MSEWISVDDRLPEISMDPDACYSLRRAHVICADDRGHVRQMTYTWQKFAKTERGRKPRWEELNGQLALSNVTHWMPLPEHPSRSGSKSS